MESLCWADKKFSQIQKQIFFFKHTYTKFALCIHDTSTVRSINVYKCK